MKGDIGMKINVALNKSCPLFNENSLGPSPNCKGPSCMLWSWLQPKRDRDLIGDDFKEGCCGLSNRPDWSFVE